MSTNIQWTDDTWNPTTGCTRVSAGCDNCYAVEVSRRMEAMGHDKKYGGLVVLNNRKQRHFNGVVKCHEDVLDKPLHWRKPKRIFVNSTSDLFHRDVPFDFIDKVFAVMALCPQHTFQILTKRPERMAEHFKASTARDGMLKAAEEMFATVNSGVVWERVLEARKAAWPLPNVWLGTSVENQATADERIPHLLRCPAAVRFVSYEPALGPVDFSKIATDFTRSQWGKQAAIHWVVVGGESGPGARPFDIAWAGSVIDQCGWAGVACFVKQLGKHPRGVNHGDPMPMDFQFDDGGEQVQRWYLPNDNKGGDPSEWPEDLRVREFPR